MTWSARPLAALALLLAATLAGCASDDRGHRTPPVEPLQASDIAFPPSSAVAPVLQAIPGGFAYVWNDTALPLSVEFPIPGKATMVRAVADSGATALAMSHAETGRRRCNNPSREDFTAGFGYPKSCSSVTAIDEPGAPWRVLFQGNAAQNSADVDNPASQGDVRIEFLDTPLDGLLAGLDLSLVDKPTLQLTDTQVLFLPSFDGELLRLEVTVPDGTGPWPTIIESSPYHDDGVRAEPSSWSYFANDWARRGYAVVVADVRGFGDSGGCVEVWGPNEQADQKVLVEWAASQPWSDGNVGFYGQSYVGTTPVEAAVQAPPALKAIVTVAPVINAYEDWHHGGVPNGESRLSPVAYQATTDQTVTGAPGAIQEGRLRTDPALLANNVKNGVCDPTLVARANDPRALYTDFYRERDFNLRAKDVTAAVLYTQGFEDANVKSAMIPGWFNDLTSPKLGLFGHWLHQHPARLDTEALMVAWFEQHLKGKPIGLEALPKAAVSVDRDTHRVADDWPPLAPVNTTLWPAFGAGGLGPDATDGRAVLLLDATGQADSLPVQNGQVPPQVILRGQVLQDTPLAGVGIVHVVAVPQEAPNAYLAAYLYEEGANGSRLITWGQFNMAHRNGHDRYEPAVPNQDTAFDLPLLPTEYVFRAGTTLRLEFRGVMVTSSTDPGGLVGQRIFLEGGQDGTRLILPGVPMDAYAPMPLTARP